jgi:hypothetical protein
MLFDDEVDNDKDDNLLSAKFPAMLLFGANGGLVKILLFPFCSEGFFQSYQTFFPS